MIFGHMSVVFYRGKLMLYGVMSVTSEAGGHW